LEGLVKVVLPAIPAEATAAEARALLEAAGWRQIATGDWSWVLASPDGKLAARVTPWDAAWRLHASACQRHPAHPHLPTIHQIAPLEGDGYVALMDRLMPCEEARGLAFCAALALSRTKGEVDAKLASAYSRSPAVQSLRAILVDLMEEGAMLPFWGGPDIRPGNLMCDGADFIKVIDPIFVAGRQILAALEAGEKAALDRVGRANLEAFLTIPVFEPGPETEALRARLKALYDGGEEGEVR
jgi:hypothetical protein